MQGSKLGYSTSNPRFMIVELCFSGAELSVSAVVSGAI